MNISQIENMNLPIQFGKVLRLDANEFSVEKIIDNPLKQSLIIINNAGYVRSIKEKNMELSVKYNISGLELTLPLSRTITSIVGILNRISKNNAQSRMKYIAAIFISKEEFEKQSFEFEMNDSNDIALIIVVG